MDISTPPARQADKPLRVLFIARNRDESMHRKVSLLSEQGDIAIRYIFPTEYRDELAAYRNSAVRIEGVECAPVPLAGPQADPHRVMYRSFGFGMRRFRPHIVHVEEEPDSLAALQVALARKLLAPHSLLLLNTWQNIDRRKNALVKAVIRFSLFESNAVLCANSTAIEILRRWGYTRPAPLIPPVGVDTRLFHPAVRQRQDKGLVNILYLGRFVPEKGIDLLIAAVATLIHKTGEGESSGNIRLMLVGNGPELDHLKQQVITEGIGQYVQFRAAMPSTGVAELLRQTDILVLPSRTAGKWKEQFGRVLIEAMASKVAVLGSSSGAIPEVIGDAGRIFREGDTNDLADNLADLIRSPDARMKLSERGYVRVIQHYTQERIAAQTVTFYRNIIQTADRRGFI